MNLYTLIFEYRGGTYISQIKAADEKKALYKWGQEIDHRSIQFMGEKLKKKLNKEISEDLFDYDLPPVQIEGTNNCWYAGPLLSGHVNIIKTDEN